MFTQAQNLTSGEAMTGLNWVDPEITVDHGDVLQVRDTADPLEETESVEDRHHQVQKHASGLLLLDGGEAGGAVGRGARNSS